jgi:SAM-dependent methyltransferase
VDRTRAYIDRAARAAAEDGVEVELVLADMRDFVRPAGFDAALNLFSSLGYFEDPAEDAKVARNVLRSLRPGGRAVFDMYGKEILARDFKERDWSRLDDVLLLEERKVSRDWTWIEARWIVIRGDERGEFTVEHRLYSGQELATLLVDAGFASVTLFGSFEGVPYDHAARRLVAVATAA